MLIHCIYINVTNFFPSFTFGYGGNLITTVAALIGLLYPLESTPPPHPSIS
jgi:hypothetical protein